MAGQGLVYLKVKQGFEFVYNGEPESDDDLLKSTFDSTCSATDAAAENGIADVEDNHHVENQDLLESERCTCKSTLKNRSADRRNSQARHE